MSGAVPPQPSVKAVCSCDTSRCRRSSCRRWWTGSQRSLAPPSWWTRTAAWCPRWSTTWDTTWRTSRGTTSKLTKGKVEARSVDCGGAKTTFSFVEVLTVTHFCFRDPEFVFYDQLKQTMNAYRFVLFLLFVGFLNLILTCTFNKHTPLYHNKLTSSVFLFFFPTWEH